MTTPKQKLKLKALLKKLGGDGIDPYVADQFTFILSEIERQVFDNTSPLSDGLIDAQLATDSLRVSISEQLALIEERAAALGIKYDGNIKNLRIALNELVSTETARLEKELHKIGAKLGSSDAHLSKELEKIKKDIEELFWLKTTNGSNNVQAVLNIKSNGTAVAMNVTGINFTTGVTVTTNPDGSINVAASGGGGATTFYTETPSGLIDGANKAYTTAHPITSIVNFAINGQYIHASEYSVSGSTITFVTALDASLSGLSFTVVYV